MNKLVLNSKSGIEIVHGWLLLKIFDFFLRWIPKLITIIVMVINTDSEIGRGSSTII